MLRLNIAVPAIGSAPYTELEKNRKTANANQHKHDSME